MAEEGPPNEVPVVGIGASAGGVESLQSFFEAVPADLGVAYVVIVHLAPDRDSGLPEILGRKTSMPVVQVGDHDTVPLRPDQVYVIAPDRKLEITDASVGASRFEQPRGQRTAIDLFFRSLAGTHDGYAMVLSGSGSDGALGAKAVKEAGGLVLVQDPREAGHDGMPRAVIATGIADVVLPVRDLAHRLRELVRERRRVGHLLRAEDDSSEMDPDGEAGLQRILQLLKTRTGHDFSRYKRNTLLRRLARRMQLHHRAQFSDYLTYLEDNVEEVQALFNDVLISVTTFFRDPAAWEALREQVIEPLVEHAAPEEQIRVWVPGCATGEEAYSVAMLFKEVMQERRADVELIIFASDVDEGALATAREGVYPSAVAADLSDSRLERFFRREDDHYRIASEVRDCVVFASHSLLRDPPFSRLHLVSCRNLLIYLTRELQEQVMEVFRYACRDEAYLFLGISESADDGLFEVVDKSHRIYQARPRSSSRLPRLPDLLDSTRAIARQGAGRRQTWRAGGADVQVSMLEDLAPPSLVVDETWAVLHMSTSAARYLQQRAGPPARSVADLVRLELQDELSSALHRAFETRSAQLSQFVAVRFNGTARGVAVLVQWRRGRDDGRDRALVTFLESGDAAPEEAPGGQEPSDDLVRNLRDQLRQADVRLEHIRDDHEVSNEDLRAANEELQSLNEEYRSTAEELETSREELQSLNEELQTVNHELKNKLEEVSRAHSDMENLMAATDVATLFLDRGLCISRFTPQLAEIFNVRPQDQGRPIADFTHNLDYTELEADAGRVVSKLVPIEHEATSRDGRAFLVRLRPYRTSDDRIDGVVVTFLDVTELKRANSVLRQSEERFRALVDASAQMVWTTDPQGRVVEDSPSWRAYTGQTFEQWQGLGWLDVVHQDDRLMVERAWAEAVRAGTIFDNEFRVYHSASGSYRWTSVRAVPLKDHEGSIRGWVGMNIDVTERREAVDDLREADQQKNDFLAVLGHELRNPLAAIRNTLQALEVAPAARPDLMERAWGVVDRQSRHMTRLVNDLLDVERIKRGRMQLSRQPVDLCQCVRDAAEALAGQIDQAGLALDLELSPVPVVVQADPERLVQMVDNLLRNSINYTNAGGRITVNAHQEAGQGVISVRDDGVGIDPEELGELFEPYYQGGHGDRAKGLGLGLTLVKRLVGMHDGTVSAHSEGAGTGSQFTLTLPIARGGLPGDAQQPDTPAAHRVLVVDDQVDIADTFAGMLTNLGQQVRVAYSGQEALDIGREWHPQLAFVDLAMPEMDGHELGRRLRERFSKEELVLIAITGYGSRYSTGQTNVFDRRVLKPVDVDTVVALLHEVAADGGSAAH